MNVLAAKLAFDWETAPLAEAQRRLRDIERIAHDARRIVAAREAKHPQSYRCWCQAHRQHVPESVLKQCRGTIIDGRWMHRSDGALDDDGTKITAVVCSRLCFEVFNQHQSQLRNQVRSR